MGLLVGLLKRKDIVGDCSGGECPQEKVRELKKRVKKQREETNEDENAVLCASLRSFIWGSGS